MQSAKHILSIRRCSIHRAQYATAPTETTCPRTGLGGTGFLGPLACPPPPLWMEPLLSRRHGNRQDRSNRPLPLRLPMLTQDWTATFQLRRLNLSASQQQQLYVYFFSHKFFFLISLCILLRHDWLRPHTHHQREA